MINIPTTFEAYWQMHMPRFQEAARKEWEALADGPFKGALELQLHDDWALSTPLRTEFNGLTEEAVANKIMALLESATLIGEYDEYDVAEWNSFQRKIVSRMRQGDYDFSEGAILAVDISIRCQD